ncbi:unnamed protein product [Lactuca virosa]|uniref:Transmembrane protein n=1 Tax=Lactuca virosa TaxID=75947 RepID=A0AAU9MYZ5_9ASTR|nr:unnamed protein product [Lactuca virosa]
MEGQDWHMIGADCLVLSCCCQFLILQMLMFLLFKLPSKVFRKAKEYVKRKFGIRRKVARCVAAFVGRQQPWPPHRDAAECFRWEELNGCMEEVEVALEEMCRKGEFGFGSFWRGDEEHDLEDNFRICFVNQQLGYHDDSGKYHFVDVFGPLTMQLI